MNDALVYAVIFYAGMIVAGLLLIYLYAIRVRQGLWSTRTIGLTIWGLTFLTFIGALQLSFITQPVILPFNNLLGKFLGVILMAFGFVLLLWAWRVFEFSYDRITSIKVDRLFTSGPYRYVRNPQYAAMFLISYGLVSVLNSFYFLVYSLILNAGMYLLVLIEEKGLEQKFGETYLQYKRKVPRFIPKLKVSR